MTGTDNIESVRAPAGMRWKQRAARALLSALGWRTVGGVPPAERYVLVLYPHTSKKDAPLWMLARFAMGIHANILVKRSAFIPPFSFLLRALGGIPVHRGGNRDQVEILANMLRDGEIRVLALSPEGTRSFVHDWHTGFYHIAEQAGVPIAPCYCDFRTRTCGVGPLVYPSGDLEADMEALRLFYEDIRGDKPQNQGPVSVQE